VVVFIPANIRRRRTTAFTLQWTSLSHRNHAVKLKLLVGLNLRLFELRLCQSWVLVKEEDVSSHLVIKLELLLNLQATKLFIVTPVTKGWVVTTPWISC